MDTRESVNHPSHYNSSIVECIDVIEHMGFNIGSSVKYIWRSNHKDKLIEDLKKSRWYIDREIERRNSFTLFQKLLNNIYSKLYSPRYKLDTVSIIYISYQFNNHEIGSIFINLYFADRYKNDIARLIHAKKEINEYIYKITNGVFE